MAGRKTEVSQPRRVQFDLRRLRPRAGDDANLPSGRDDAGEELARITNRTDLLRPFAKAIEKALAMLLDLLLARVAAERVAQDFPGQAAVGRMLVPRPVVIDVADAERLLEGANITISVDRAGSCQRAVDVEERLRSQ